LWLYLVNFDCIPVRFRLVIFGKYLDDIKVRFLASPIQSTLPTNGDNRMIVKVWEAYKKDSQESCSFLTKELAENQAVFDEVDLIIEAVVDLSDGEIMILNDGLPVY